MQGRSQFTHEDVSAVPRGYRVRTITHPSGARVRVAFPPGPRRKGTGRLISILHPNGRSQKSGVRSQNGKGLHLSLCTDPDFASELNPQAISYLKAAGKHAQAGHFAKASKALSKYVRKRKTELAAPKKRRENPGVLAAAARGALFSGALAALNPKSEDAKAEEAKRIVEAYRRKGKDALWARGKGGGFWVKDGSGETQYISLKMAREHTRGFMNPRQRNASDATQVYADFHGREPREVLDLHQALMKSGEYAAIGGDPELWLKPVTGDPNHWPKPEITFEPGKAPVLVVNGDCDNGKKGVCQLYFAGGDQRLSGSELKAAGYDTSKRFIVLGIAHAIAYETEKKFDGFKTKSYAHIFGEEDGKKPTVIYDRDTATLLLVGGGYYIKDYDKGLGASPGIAN